jgi:hypothetical protein
VQIPYTFNLSELTTKFHILAMFVMGDSQTIFHMLNIGMLMIYLCTEFHISSSNSSSVTAIKPKAKVYFLTVPILFYILKKYYLTKNFQSPLPHITSVPLSKQGLHHKFILMPYIITDCNTIKSMALGCPPMA